MGTTKLLFRVDVKVGCLSINKFYIMLPKLLEKSGFACGVHESQSKQTGRLLRVYREGFVKFLHTDDRKCPFQLLTSATRKLCLPVPSLHAPTTSSP